MLHSASARARTFTPGTPIGPSRKRSQLWFRSPGRGARCCRCGCCCWCRAGYILNCCRKSGLFGYERFQLGSCRPSGRCRRRRSRSRFGYRTIKTDSLLCSVGTCGHCRFQFVVAITDYIGINRAGLVLCVHFVYARILFSFNRFIYAP